MKSFPNSDDIGHCPQCGLDFVPALEEDRRYHRKVHARWLKPRRPQPDARIAALAVNGELMVDTDSPRWLHKRVYEIARALQQEEAYDFPQWDEDGECTRRDDDGFQSQYHATLFVEPQGLVIGACAFAYVKWNNRPPGWHLAFVWIADDYRRKGHLSRRWAGLKQKYGDFTIEHPLSEAMEEFVRKLAGAATTAL